MKPIHLYIENFMCYDRAYIDFTQFSAALIIGKIENNDLFSNGVGKTTIFRAFEYALFNQADVNLENIVRDDTGVCRVVIDFLIGDQEYRLSRSRTKKGNTDLTLLQRNAQSGLDIEVYHKIVSANNLNEYDYLPYIDKKDIEKYWKDLSGSRAGDTEKDLVKLVKFTHKSFRSTVHFMQKDLMGLPTVTAEKRKGILKDALSLLVYAKLEKLAKEKANILSKEIDRQQTLLESLGDPEKELIQLFEQLAVIEKALFTKNNELTIFNEKIKHHNDMISELTINHSTLENKFTALLDQKTSIINDKDKLETSVKEYSSKCANVIKAAKNIIEEINLLKENQIKLASLNYSQIDILTEQIEKYKEQIAQNNQIIKTNLSRYEELKVPLPSGSVCEKCRKPMSDTERKSCQEHIAQDIENLQKEIHESKKIITKFNVELMSHQQTVNSLNLSKQQLENINTKITNKNKEYQDKNETHTDYRELLNKFKKDLEDKNKELEIIQIELKNSSIEEANNIKLKIEMEKQKITTIMSKFAFLTKEITHYNSNMAVVQHGIEQKNKDKIKKSELNKLLSELNEKYVKFPAVIQGFSSTGIPNLIIQDVLDDLQIESNILLNQLKPGLQLSFLIEKTTGNGEQADTLDIHYQINGRNRYYEQLSGAQQLAVLFSLKLGLSFLLQKRIGVDIKFLLLDEIDQSLDKASVDAFADIVKFFQKDFIILVITHNDRLKDKFSHAILVEQDMNLVSKAKVVSSW